MSSTHRGAVRAPLDAYYTPDHVADACVQATQHLLTGRVWDPHAGGGAFVRAVARLPTAFSYASDISPHAPPDEEFEAYGVAGWRANHDALSGFPFAGSPDWIIGNPPFDAAWEHIESALQTATAGVAFLLRLGFLEGTDRQESFWRRHRCAEIHSFVRRPSFLERYEDGTIGPLRKRDENGEPMRGKRSPWALAGTDSAAYGWFIWRRGYNGPTHHHFLDWK